jgi:hypothetical protein
MGSRGGTPRSPDARRRRARILPPEAARSRSCAQRSLRWRIEAGIELPYLATIMGTSIVLIQQTYFRWLNRTPNDQLRAAFDACDAAANG